MCMLCPFKLCFLPLNMPCNLKKKIGWRPDMRYRIKGTLVKRPFVLWGEGKHSVLLWLGPGLLVSLCPWVVNFICDSQFSLPFGGIECQEWVELSISLPPGWLSCDKNPNKLGPISWVKQFPLRAGLVKRNRKNLLAYFSMVIFPFPCQNHGGTFFWHSLWEPGRVPIAKTHRSEGNLPWLDLLEF